MEKKILFLSLALLTNVSLFAQKQEKIYYDKDWKVCSQSKAEFYRIVNYDENGKPIGKINDYFVTGELQAEIESALYIDKVSDSKSKFVGFTEGFYKSGAKEFETIYDNQSNIVTHKSWYENGQPLEYKEYENGKLDGKTKKWYEDGQLHQEVDYKNGKLDGKMLIYWGNGNIKRIDEYKDGKLITGKCFNIDGKEITYFKYLILPEFPGGIEKLLQYLSKEIRYPDYSLKNKIEGKVIVYFAVNVDGEISDIEIRQSVSEDIDKESLRVIKKMPKWIPGTMDGEAVKTFYTLPILFRLPTATTWQ